MRAAALPRAAEAFEASPLGRAAVSLVLVVTLAFVVATNLPPSFLRTKVLDVGQPYLNAVGLDQNWNVFAPEQRRQVIELRADATYDDGLRRSWHIPQAGPLVGQYWDYRWRKWVENEIGDANRKLLWPAAARYALDRLKRPGHRVVRLVLVRRWFDLLPPGANRDDRGPWQELTYYVWILPSSGGPGPPPTPRP